ncbi:MAG: hypothetical protein HYX66_02505 [Ignavibacteria bacterium]|nr:hypothetical protein [Ignavibacteria bacterium]
MKQAILIRVSPENFDQWRQAHDECMQARLEYGMTDGPVYRDEIDSNIVLVQLNVESMEKASGWFKDDRFKAAVQRAGKVTREFWNATLKE